MHAHDQRVEAILAEVLEIQDPAQRCLHIQRACAGDAALQKEVESLLESHEKAGGFMKTRVIPPQSTLPPDAKSGDLIGHYKLLEKIGEGGCGVVWMAEQQEPVRRLVALKIIKLGMDTRQIIARFEAERQAMAMMDHPNIARVLDAGATAGGRPFFVMELVRGVPITEFCDQAKLSTRARLELFMKVCNAVQHAHQKAVIHRDIKPGNVLVTMHDGEAVPKVIDFGVAKALGQKLTEKTLFTGFSQMIGTPAYMSPEQTVLNSLDIDTRADIYSLGVLLYELLTGVTPFDSETIQKAALDEICRMIRETEPPKPSTRIQTLHNNLTEVAMRRGADPAALRKMVSGDLDWIVMKCLEKDRRRRYDTPHALSQDIARHLGSEPVWAGPPGVVYRVRKFICRNKLAVASAAIIAGAFLAGGTLSAWQWRRAEQARRGETSQRLLAETNANEKRNQLVRLDVANGVRALDNEDWFGALFWFTEALAQDRPQSPDESKHRTRIGTLLQYAPRLEQVWPHSGAVRAVSFHPGGRQALITATGGMLHLWNVDSGQRDFVLHGHSNISDAFFSSDGRRVIAFSRNERAPVIVWDAVTGRQIGPVLENNYRLSHVMATPDGQKIITIGDPHGIMSLQESFDYNAEHTEILIRDVATGRPICRPFKSQGWIADAALSPDGRWLAVVQQNGVQAWNLSEPRAFCVTNPASLQMGTVTSPPPSDSNGNIILMPNMFPSRTLRAPLPEAWAFCVAFSPQSDRILIGLKDGSGSMLAWQGGTPVMLRGPKPREDYGQAGGKGYAAFTPDGSRAVIVDKDGIVRYWDAGTGELEGQLDRKTTDRPEISPDGRFINLSGQVWDLNRRQSVTPVVLHPYGGQMAFSPDGERILTGGSDGTARLWHLSGIISPLPRMSHAWNEISRSMEITNLPQPGTIRESMEQDMLRHYGEMNQAIFNRDGSRLLTVCGNGTARLWDARSGAGVHPYVWMNTPLAYGVFSASGRCWAVSGGYVDAGQARAWNSMTGIPASPLIQAPVDLRELQISPDGRWLVTKTHGGTKVWDVQTGTLAQWPVLEARQLACLAWNAEGTRAAVSTQDESGCKTVIYDVAAWRPCLAPLDETNQVHEMQFSPDGRWLCTLAGRPNTNWIQGFNKVDSACLWDVSTGRRVPFDFQGFVIQAHFTSDSRRLFVTHAGGQHQVWNLAEGRLEDKSAWRGMDYGFAVLSANGECVLARNEQKIVLYDNRTGEPLTPPLGGRRNVRAVRLALNPSADMLAVAARDQVQLWPIRREDRPLPELISIARLLAGQRSGYATLDAEELARVWKDVRSRPGNDFGIKPEQIRAWHEQIVEESEKQEQWFAALFHLDQLLRAFPGDEPLRVRRARALNQSAMKELDRANTSN